MAGRPVPRKSNLAGSSPVKPAETATDTATATTHTPETEPISPIVTNPVVEIPPQKRKYPHKVSFYQDTADTDRVRGAILHTMISEGNRNLSQFIHKAVMKEVERLESVYNNGNPWPPVGAKDMPQGAAAHGEKKS